MVVMIRRRRRRRRIDWRKRIFITIQGASTFVTIKTKRH